MFVSCDCCVLSGRGLCDELITRPEKSYRLWCTVVCDIENLKNEEPINRVGSQRHKKITSMFIDSNLINLYLKFLYDFLIFLTLFILISTNHLISNLCFFGVMSI
jgi:hypothetical protein